MNEHKVNLNDHPSVWGRRFVWFGSGLLALAGTWLAVDTILVTVEASTAHYTPRSGLTADADSMGAMVLEGVAEDINKIGPILPAAIAVGGTALVLGKQK